MDSTLIIVVVVSALVVLGAGLIWILRIGPGRFWARVGGQSVVEFEVTSEDEKPTPNCQAKQVQEDVEDGYQEQPSGAGATQQQKKVKRGEQRIK